MTQTNFSIDITPGARPQKVYVSEYDVGREYIVTLLDGKEEFTIPSGATATIEGTIADHGFVEEASIINNKVYFWLTESMTAIAGKAWTKIKLVLNDEPVSTCAFILVVDRAGVEVGTVINAPGFEEQIVNAVNAWLDENGGGLPSGGIAGQYLVSDGKGGGVWVDAAPSGDDIPLYVKAAAQGVVSRVRSKLQNDSIVVMVGSDSHESATAHVSDGNLHGGMAMKEIANALSLDFAAYLGDYTAGSGTTTISEGIGHIDQINEDIADAFQGLPQFRTVGNHDPLGYSYSQNGTALAQSELYTLIGSYNADGTTVMGSVSAGYCYRDFPSKQIRVICLNTAEADGEGRTPPQGSAEFMTTAQKCWFAETLISTPSGYGIIILSHHPLDWGRIVIQASHILRAYVDELAPAQQNPINFGSGVTYDFTGKNKSAWVIQLHGHVHGFKVDNLHYVANITTSTTAQTYDVKRIAVPNMCFVRNNEYGQNSGEEYYDIEFGETTTYPKTADSGEDTAFCVMVINPSEQKVHAICYGAGYDREVYFGANTVAVTGVTLNANSGTLAPGATTTLTATVAPNNATNKTVLWSTSDSSVATVNNGTVTAVAVGTATITATTQDGGFTATYTLTVQAIERGNLRDYFGYTDGKRVSASDGTYREVSGGTVVEYIDLSEFVTNENTITIRTKGVQFQSWQSGSNTNYNAYVFYNQNKGFTTGAYLTDGSGTHGNITVTRSFAGDSDNTMTLTISNIGMNIATTSYHYLRLCGLGNGANLDIRVNEDFT